jgi:hypothetical protein
LDLAGWPALPGGWWLCAVGRPTQKLPYSKATCIAAVDVVYTALMPTAYTVPLLAASFSSFLL